MALKQHTDHRVRFDQQVENSAAYVMPFIEATQPVGKGTTVLEVGTGEGGVLRPFIEKGATGVGVDLAHERIQLANEFMADEVAAGKALFTVQNIYEDSFLAKYKGYFDIVILKDVIEHVPEQQQFVLQLKKFLKPGGQIFFGFPPWYMPFGGHQQVLKHKWLSKLPYYHILPAFLYKAMLKMAGESEPTIKEMMEIKETQITIEQFERIIKSTGMKVLKKQHYLINPIYKYKFGLQPRVQWAPLSHIPFLRNFVTTCVYYTVG